MTHPKVEGTPSDGALPSRFQLNERVRIIPPPGDWSNPPEERTVVRVSFTESKVFYDLQGADLIANVDSCDVEPA